MKLSELLSCISCSGNIREDFEIKDIVYDSRKAGDGCLFVCLSGLKLDVELRYDYTERKEAEECQE